MECGEVTIGLSRVDAPARNPIVAPRMAPRRRRWPALVGAVLVSFSLVAVGWLLGSTVSSSPTDPASVIGLSSSEPDAATGAGDAAAGADEPGANDPGSGSAVSNEQNTIEVLARLAPSTASLQVIVGGQVVGPGGSDDQRPQQSAGSGFVIDVQGDSYLVSNFHVVQSALEPETATLRDDAVIAAGFAGAEPIRLDVVGVNPSFDLALLRALDPANPLPDVEPIPIADSDLVLNGQKAIAIGNPFGFDSTATVGVVSATGRFLESIGEVAIPMIQTDAAINPGNSGGALLNSAGELIGVNTALFNPESGSFAGLGFAVPSNLLKEALANLELGGVSDISDTRPILGVELASLAFFPPQIREEAGLPDAGVMVVSTVPGGSADRAGLTGAESVIEFGGFRFPADGDIIVAVGGIEVSTAEALNVAVTYGLSSGDVIELRVVRQGQEFTVDVTLD